MAKKLDIDQFSEQNRFQIVGRITNEIIDFLKQNSDNEILNVLHETDILLWGNRIEYTEKHKGNGIICFCKQKILTVRNNSSILKVR